MREVPNERLVNPKKSIIEEIPYEKEPKCTEPISSIMPTSTPELIRKSANTEELNSHTTLVCFYMTHMHRL
jgi:hypothetical protein